MTISPAVMDAVTTIDTQAGNDTVHVFGMPNLPPGATSADAYNYYVQNDGVYVNTLTIDGGTTAGVVLQKDD